MHHSPILVYAVLLGGMSLLIWLPYVWPFFGRQFRRNSGPWLINFDHHNLLLALLRDVLYTLSIWCILFFVRLWYETPLVWIALAIGLIAMCFDIWLRTRLERDGEESTGIIIIFAVELTEAQLRMFLQEYGALIFGKQSPYLARVAYPNGYLWIRFVSSQLAEFDPQNYTGESRVQMTEQLVQINHLLAGEPQTLLGLTVTKSALGEGERAAQALILALNERWHCVVETQSLELLSDQTITQADMQKQPLFGFEKTSQKWFSKSKGNLQPNAP